MTGSMSKAKELKKSLEFDNLEEKLVGSVMDNDEETINQGKLMASAINQGFSSFTPDMMFDNIKKDFANAQNLYGEKVLRLLSGYSPDYIKKNIRIPEFARMLKEKIKEKADELKKRGLIDKQGFITDKGRELASLVLYVEELDKMIPKGILGEKVHKKSSPYGTKDEIRPYRKGDRYKDIAVRRTIKTAIRRGHGKINIEDIRSFDRQSKGSISVIYAIDASGSMRGRKIEAAKKAGIALAYKATSSNDKVGLIVFGTEVKEKVSPTLDFPKLLKKISSIRASKETNMTESIKQSIDLFGDEKTTKHLIIISDALPTIGKEPEREVIETIHNAQSNGITVSIAGINLDNKGSKLAQKIAEIGKGRFYVVRDVKNMNQIILEDYHSL